MYDFLLQIAAFKGFLYAVAGSKVYLKLQNSVEKYDPRNDSWVTIANVPETGHVGVSSLGNRLICAGFIYLLIIDR